MGQRLPVVNSDDGAWGQLLRDWLMKEHYDDGNIGNSANGGHQNVTIRPGTATAAPLTFSAGTNLSTAAAGSVEYNGSDFFITPSGTNRYKIVGDTYAQTLSNKTLDNTSTITVKDANFTLQDDVTATKTAQFQLSSLTGSRTYTLPDETTILAGQEVIQSDNLILDPSFETDALWANAFGVQTTAQAYIGTKSRRITATGAGPGVAGDRLTLTHDSTGSPIKIWSGPNKTYRFRVYLRKDAANTGSAAPALYFQLREYDSSGTEGLTFGQPINETDMSSAGWFYWDYYSTTTSTAAQVALMVTIDAATPVGNKYYVDSVHLEDVSTIATYNLTLQNKTLGTGTVISSLPTGSAVSNGAATSTTGAATPVTASTLVARDTFGNVNSNNINAGLSSTTNSGGTIVLTASSNYFQYISGAGTGTQTVQLPNTSTLALGVTYMIMNVSPGTVNVNASDGSNIFVLGSFDYSTFTCVSTSITTSAAWFYNQFNVGAASGKDVYFENTFDFKGTDGTIITFPSISDNLVGTTAVQTISNKNIVNKTLTKTANYSVVTTDQTQVYFADATSGNVTITLPAASSNTGYRFDVKRIDGSANQVLVSSAGGTIDGAASWTLDMRYTSISVVSDGTNWYIL